MYSKKWWEAEPLLKKAVELHPSYAAAWYRLGLCRQYQNRAADAREAYRRALEAEPKYPDALYTLATLDLAEERWSAVADRTDEVIRLDPSFLGAYYMNAAANLRLGNVELAQENARHGLQLDTKRRLPKLEQVLALALAQSSQYAEATKHLRSYIKRERDRAERELARKQLDIIERRNEK
jgi:tetratricopeptide (TPR) repeat protein